MKSRYRCTFTFHRLEPVRAGQPRDLRLDTISGTLDSGLCFHYVRMKLHGYCPYPGTYSIILGFTDNSNNLPHILPSRFHSHETSGQSTVVVAFQQWRLETVDFAGFGPDQWTRRQAFSPRRAIMTPLPDSIAEERVFE